MRVSKLNLTLEIFAIVESHCCSHSREAIKSSSENQDRFCVGQSTMPKRRERDPTDIALNENTEVFEASNQIMVEVTALT